MKKRLVAMIAMVAMVVMMLPTVAFAAEGTVLYVNGAYTGADSDGTVDKPYTKIADAVAKATGGEVIEIAAFDGEYNAFRLDNKSGITFKGVADDAGNKPVIACAQDNVYTFKSQNTGVVGANNVSDTTFTGIIFKNYGKQAGWLDTCIAGCTDCGSDWDGLVIDNCDFVLVDGASATYAISPCCGDLTFTNSTIIGYDNGICLMDDGGALVNVTLTGNTIKVANEVINGYWGNVAADVISKVEISGNDITGVDEDTTPVIYVIDYVYQLKKGTEDVTGIDVINVSNNTGEALIKAENINGTSVTVQEDWEVKKSFHTEALANGSKYIEAGEGFYIGNVLYVLDENNTAVTHTECTDTEVVNASEETCTVDGYTGDKKCTECGAIVEVGTVIPATGHTEKKVDTTDATCTKEGYTGDVICTVCQTVLETGEATPVVAHTYLDGVCTMCGEADPDYVAEEDVQLGIDGTDTEASLDAEADTITTDIVNGTITDNGNYEVVFKEDVNIEEKAEEIASGEVEIVIEVVATPIAEEEVESETAGEIETKLDEVAEEIAADSVEAVEESGIAQYLDLSVLIKAQDTETETKVTLGEFAKTENPITFTITIPEKYLQPGYEVFILRNHNGVVTKLPLTANDNGTHSFTTNLFSTYALAYVTTHVHTETVINAVAADCGNDGYTGDTVCAACGELIAQGSVIAADGNHHWSEWKNQEGIAYTFRECWDCGASEYLTEDTAVDAPAAGNIISTPATGDTSNVFAWVSLMVACCGVVLGTMVYRKNR